MMIPDAQRKRGAPLTRPARISDSVNTNPGNRLQSLNQPPDQLRFMRNRRAVGRGQRLPPSLHETIRPAPKFCKILNSRTDPRDQFVQLRTGFPTIRTLFAARTYLVRPKMLQMLALPIKNAGVRSKKFVRRANQEIAMQRL